MSDVPVCRIDGEPLVFTFEFPGAEYVCVVCGVKEDIFPHKVETTPELVARHAELSERYHREYAERRGMPPPRPTRKVGDPGVSVPVCVGCGKVPELGTVIDGDKPALWFSRTVDGRTEYACSRACIPDKQPVAPW